MSDGVLDRQRREHGPPEPESGSYRQPDSGPRVEPGPESEREPEAEPNPELGREPQAKPECAREPELERGVAGSATSGETKWLVLVYRAPVEPSTARVRVWRKVRELGGLYIQQAVSVFPARPDTERAVLRLSKEIRELGAESFLFRAEAEPQEAVELIERFRAQSDQEYREILEQCRGLLEELATETDKGKFTFAEIEENEGDLAYIERWVEKAIARDFFKGALRDEVLGKVEECRARMEEFESEVFRCHSDEH